MNEVQQLSVDQITPEMIQEFVNTGGAEQVYSTILTNTDALLPLLAGVTIIGSIMALLSLFVIILCGFALWKAARRNQKGWFIAILLFGSTIILPIIYLLVVRDPQPVVTQSV